MKERSVNLFQIFIGIFILSLCIACSSSDTEPDETNQDYVPTPKPLTVPPIF
jgi:cytochrome c peroxidase